MKFKNPLKFDETVESYKSPIIKLISAFLGIGLAFVVNFTVLPSIFVPPYENATIAITHDVIYTFFAILCLLSLVLMMRSFQEFFLVSDRREKAQRKLPKLLKNSVNYSLEALSTILGQYDVIEFVAAKNGVMFEFGVSSEIFSPNSPAYNKRYYIELPDFKTEYKEPEKLLSALEPYSENGSVCILLIDGTKPT